MKTLLNVSIFGRNLAVNADGDPTTGAVTGVSFDEIMASLTTLTPEEKQQLIEALSINLGQEQMLASKRQDTSRQFTSQLARTLGVPATTPLPRMMSQINSLLKAGTSAQFVLIEQECEKVAGAKELRTFDGSVRKENNAYRYLINHIDHEDLNTAKQQIDAIAKGDKIFKQLLADIASHPSATVTTRNANSNHSNALVL